MVYQHEALDLTCNEVGTNLCVDPSTVSRTVQLFRRTGHVSKKQYDTSNLPCQLTEAIQILLLQIVLDRPGVMLHEIIAEIKYITETELTPSTIGRFLHQSRFSRQRMRLAATQRDEIFCAAFASEVCLYNAETPSEDTHIAGEENQL